MAPWPKDMTTADSTWNTAGQTATATDFTTTTHWYSRLRGPRYDARQATVRLMATRGQKPEKFLNMNGIEYKRTTRRGRHHFYRAT